jgi:hypothetical protein
VKCIKSLLKKASSLSKTSTRNASVVIDKGSKEPSRKEGRVRMMGRTLLFANFSSTFSAKLITMPLFHIEKVKKGRIVARW